MNSLFDTASVAIPCPHCGQKTDKTVGWLKANNRLACACGTVIHLDTDQFRSGIADADQAVQSLRDTVRRIGK